MGALTEKLLRSWVWNANGTSDYPYHLILQSRLFTWLHVNPLITFTWLSENAALSWPSPPSKPEEKTVRKRIQSREYIIIYKYTYIKHTLINSPVLVPISLFKDCVACFLLKEVMNHYYYTSNRHYMTFCNIIITTVLWIVSNYHFALDGSEMRKLNSADHTCWLSHI